MNVDVAIFIAIKEVLVQFCLPLDFEQCFVPCGEEEKAEDLMLFLSVKNWYCYNYSRNLT